MKMTRVSAIAALVLAASSAFAVRPAAFVHQTETDFADGAKFENTVINSYGELTLGREVTAIGVGEGVEMTVGVVAAQEGTFVAVMAGGTGKVLKINNGKTAEIFTLPDEDGILTAIGVDAKGEVLLATSDGKQAKLSPLKKAQGKYMIPKPVFEKKGVENIWAICAGPDGATYIGTGPKGAVYRIGDDGTSAVLEDAGKNILAVAFDKKMRLIAGSDGSGLVIRVGEDKKPFVLFEAGAGIDITALAVDEEGNIFAGKAKGEQEANYGLHGLMPEGPGSKSKPGSVEEEPMEDPEEEVPTGDGKKAPPKVHTPPLPPKVETQPKAKPTTKPVTSMMESSTFDAGIGETYFVQKSGGDFLDQLKKNLLASGDKKSEKKGLMPPRLGGKGGRNPLLPLLPGLETEPANGVIKIAADGSVSTVLAGEDMVMSLLLHKGPHGAELLIGTGTEGKIFAYALEDEAQTLVARVKEESVTALALDKDGAVLVGVSDLGEVYTLSPNLAAKGTYVSKVLDAGRPATFGGPRIVATEGKGAATIATRSGNIEDIEKQEKFWSAWSAEVDAKGGKEASPSARYLQYRVSLTGDGKESSPTVDSVSVAYAVKNLPPRIGNLSVQAGPGALAELADKSEDGPAAEAVADISWEATDPNGDHLVYRLYYKPVDAKDENWTPIVKDLREATYEWPTHTLPDGKYQVKVVASDLPDNAADEAKSVARVSAPFIVDHTAPEISELKAEVVDGKVTVSGSGKDGISVISDVRFQIDGAQDWQVAKASDKLFDSPSEAFTLTTRQLPAGGHRITVRVTDAAGNSAYKAVSVTVK